MAGESAGAAARRMREKAERLQRAADHWERGAAGERATGAVLELLPRTDWTVFHDLRWPGRQRANIDHVVVGPTGVFVIDSKNWTGPISVQGGVLRQNGRLRQPAITAAAEAARAMSRVTTSTTPAHVHPVLCFVRDEPVAARSGGVMLCSTATLLTQLTTLPPVLTEATRARVCRDIGVYVQPAQRVVPSRMVQGPLPSPNFALRKLRQLVAALVCFAAGIGGIVVLATSDAPERISDLLTSVTEVDEPNDEPRNADRRNGQKDKNQGQRQQRERRNR